MSVGGDHAQLRRGLVFAGGGYRHAQPWRGVTSTVDGDYQAGGGDHTQL